MIPRLKPYLGREELAALVRHSPGAVARFESEFARTFQTRHAIAFPYGRSALWACFKALGIESAEIILPAYTCVVVAHAIVLSGNRPRFVDVMLDDYNMDLDQVETAIGPRTRAVIATHLFGYPLDIERLENIVRAAEARYEHKIWIIQDCAHAFGAEWQRRPVCAARDMALFGLNISKMITSIFGGVLTTQDAGLAGRVRRWRDDHFAKPNWVKAMRRRFYLMAVYPAFHHSIYPLILWLQEETHLLDRLTKAYHLDDEIHLPPDYLDHMLDVEAEVGLAQLQKYSEIVKRRQDIARYYDEHLRGTPGLKLPPIVPGATYSHYVLRVANRTAMMQALQKQDIQLGQLIEYSVPHLPAYAPYTDGCEYPHSLWCSQHTINLPVYPQLTPDQWQGIVESLKATAYEMALRGASLE